MLNDMARQTTREQTSQLEAESVLPRRPWWLWGICLLVALGVAWFMLHLGSSGLPFRTAPGFQHFGAVPDFVLFERSGQPVTRADLLGKVWIASVIFTRCAEECPLVSSHMARLQGTLATEPDVRLVSITVDPAYDTPAVLTRYAQHFAAQPQRWLFLTGDQATIYRLVREGLHLGVVGPTEAVRSSALEEDMIQHSFAGQLESFLFVSPSDVPHKVAEVWRSGFSERVLTYRRAHGLALIPQAPAVLIQRMVNADVAGVAFSADPVTGRRSIAVVAAVYGLGTALVSGECDADTYHVDRDEKIIQRDIVNKSIAHRYAPESSDGVQPVFVPEEEAQKPALSDEQICAVAELVRRTEHFFGRPQDIEWAIEGSQLFLLQSRAITSLLKLADPDGILNLWDNSNIAESYGGITTPLTFSFARRAYEEVYRQFCRIMRVPSATIASNHDVFRCMLGLIHGRVYYNLLNWYRLLAMLPGFKVNRPFMEQMMGVKESLPESVLGEGTQTTWQERMKDRWYLLGSVSGLLANYLLLGRRMEGFYLRLTHTLGAGRPDLTKLRADELVAYYRNLERQLLTRWDAPLINDFFAMIFYGLLRKLTGKWCHDTEGTLQNDLLCGEGGMISIEPAERMGEMAQIAAREPPFVEVLSDGSQETIFQEMERFPDLTARYHSYLEKFGDRCLDELKLESPTLYDDPLPLLRSIGQLARRLQSQAPAAQKDHQRELDRRHQAENRVQEALAGNPIRRLIFRWVLKNARARVRDRENLRFERTRVFGRARMIFVELGRRFYALDLLDDPREIFYLEVEEVLGFVEGTISCTDLRGLVAVRKAEFEKFVDRDPPADRFETRGIVYQGNTFRRTGADEDFSGDERRGIGCCPGKVRGQVRVITAPKEARLQMGSILAAERTDPSWIMLFPFAAGLLVERGSLLSHSAIVAREMGIPAIVSIEGLTRWLKDGECVELDGSTGIVRKVKPPQGDPGDVL